MPSLLSLAQKETYDVVSFTLPAGWKKEVKENGVQLYTGNDKTGEYAMALIIKSSPTDASARDNFNTTWTKLVKGTVTVTEEPAMLPASTDKGWEIITGQAYYTDGNNKGLATLVTATGGGKMAHVVLMSNADQYQQVLADFLQSVVLNEPATTLSRRVSPSPLAGKIWEGTSKEKFVSGTLNGHYTGGYFTYQYRFNADGTYRFVYVGASAYTGPNTLQYETGTYSINGDQLTITPAKGSNEEWSVTGGPVKLSAMSDVQINTIKSTWGKKLKTTTRKLERYTYAFRVEYMAGNKANALVLEYKGPTVREGNRNRSYYFETPAEKAAALPGTLP
jgi:hypothetical protein